MTAALSKQVAKIQAQQQAALRIGTFGGDTGGMGEGFGDYWAGSYSYSTPNGPVFNPNWMFTWDGHSSCWPGRITSYTAISAESISSTRTASAIT